VIADLKPYPTMKDSGVEWLGDLPQSWDVLRGRQLFEIKKRIAGRLGHAVLSVTQAGLRVRNVATGEGQVSQDYSKYQIVNVGDFAMNSMDLLTGGVGIAEIPGVTSPDYRVFSIRDEQLCSDRYMLHVMRLLYQNKGFYAWGQGSAQLGRWRLPRKRFNDFPFPVPPPPEQAAIVRYLDHVDRRVRRLVRAKRKLIALLNEQKQAIIHRAVTRGLDPDVPLKDSGVEWLGEEPEHWGMSRLGRLTKRIGDGLHGTPEYVDKSEYHFVNGNNLANGGIAVSDATRCVSADEYEKHRIDLDGSTILMSINGTIGNVAYYADEKVILGKSAAYFKCGVELSRGYLFYMLQSQKALDLLGSEATGTTILNLSLESLRRLPVPLPPLDEQERIASYLQRYAAAVDAAAARAAQELDRLREYRTRLIADVVTGKLDIRDAAAALPEVDPLDEDELNDGGESDEDPIVDDSDLAEEDDT
jgi:type I restriction enzyme S subunit